MRRLGIAIAVLALTACGQKADLKPRPGKQLPPAPYGREVKPSADDLTRLTTQAAPERSVELRKRSEERTDDPFDLPPS